MLLLLIFLIGYSTPLGPSSLQKISENFRILSRVTNAIHLQSTLVKKDFKTSEVLAELLEISKDRFDILMDLDTNGAISELNQSHLAHKNLFEGVDPNEMIRNRLEILDFLDVLNTIGLVDKKILNNTDSENLLESIKSPIESFKLHKSCEAMDPRIFLEFRNLFSKNGRYLKFPWSDKEIKAGLNKFLKEKANIIACLGGFEDLNEATKDLNISAVYKKFQAVKGSAEFILDFAVGLAKITELKGLLPILKNNITIAKSIWDQGNPQNVMGQLQGAIEAFEDHLRESKYSTPPIINTAGFRGPRDLQKVQEDINSKFFKEKIALKASTKDLEKALYPLRSLTTVILNLETSWDAIKNLNLSEDGGIEKLSRISRFAENSSYYLNLLDDSIGIFEKCVKPLDTNKIMEKLGDFRGELSAIEDVTVKFLEWKLEILTVTDHLSFFSYPNQTRFSSYENLIYKLYYIYKDGGEGMIMLNKMEKAIKKRRLVDRKMDKEIDFLGLVERVGEVLKQWKDLKSKAGKLKKQQMGLKDLLKAVDVFGIDECLREQKFDAKDLKFAMLIYENIIGLPGKEVVEQIKKFLDLLGEVQNQFSTVQSEIHKITSKRLVPNDYKLIVQLNDSKLLSQQIGSNTKFLENLEKTRLIKDQLTSIPKFPDEVKKIIDEHELTDWLNPLSLLRNMFMGIDKVNRIAGTVEDRDVVSMAKVFEEAADVQGLEGGREAVFEMSEELTKYGFLNEKNYFESAQTVDLDFARHRPHLKNSQIVVLSLKNYFDEIFGNSRKEKKIEYVEEVSWPKITGICFGTVVVMIVLAMVGYGLTQGGRIRYHMLWLYYFGKPEEFERRWRYSLFMDNYKSKNLVLDAVREVNPMNLLKALKNGAYINVYNKYGNTALHVATKLGYVQLVDLLIKYGADRSLLNAQNKTAEQLIPLNQNSEKVENMEKIQAIFMKNRKKKFRISVPHQFPVNSFHLWLEEDTNIELSNKFMAKFPSIVSDESQNVTHLVVKTDENGVLTTDKMDLLSWIFNGIIIIKEQYMTDCLVDESLLSQDSKYLVENVRYKGVIYNSVLQWSEAMAKGAMPFLCGAYVAVVMETYHNLRTITTIVDAHGGIMMEQFPEKRFFNVGSRPYLHANLGPLFLIHDGTTDLSYYQSDPDKMYTLFTEEEFLAFMLKREIQMDNRENPIPQLKEKKK